MACPAQRRLSSIQRRTRGGGMKTVEIRPYSVSLARDLSRPRPCRTSLPPLPCPVTTPSATLIFVAALGSTARTTTQKRRRRPTKTTRPIRYHHTSHHTHSSAIMPSRHPLRTKVNLAAEAGSHGWSARARVQPLLTAEVRPVSGCPEQRRWIPRYPTFRVRLQRRLRMQESTCAR